MDIHAVNISEGDDIGEKPIWFQTNESGQTRPPTHKLACLSCRNRKVRCDRRDPCSRCLHTGESCLFPTGCKPRQRSQPATALTMHDEKLGEISRKLDAICSLIESFGENCTQGGVSPATQTSNLALPTPRATVAPSSPSPGAQVCVGGLDMSQLSESEHEGESSLCAQAARATRFFQDVIQSDDSTHSSSKITEALDALRHTSEPRTAHNHCESLRNTFPYAEPLPRSTVHRDMTMPPLQTAVACLRKLRSLTIPSSFSMVLLACVDQANALLACARIKYFWALEFHSVSQFVEYLHTVYLTDEASTADHIIVNAGLYWLLVECSIVTNDEVLKAEYKSQSQHCRNNLETLLSGLPFHLPSNKDVTLALCMAGTYMLEKCRPSAAWGFVVAASHMSQVLGYHRSADPGTNDTEAKRQCTRLFWVIYIMEKMLSLRLGRPSTIRDSDISVQLMGDVINSDEALMPVMSKWVHMAKIHGKLYDEMYSLAALSQTEDVRTTRAMALADELYNVHHSQSPAEACFLEARHRELGDSLGELFLRAPRVSYLSLLTLIYQGLPVNQASGDVVFSNKCIFTARQALEEHRQCINLLSQQTDSIAEFYTNWFLLASPFVPFTVLFCHVIQTSETTDLEHLEIVVRTLQSMPPDRREIFGKQHRLFKHLYNMACTYIEIKANARESLPDGTFERFIRETGLTIPFQQVCVDGTKAANLPPGEGRGGAFSADHNTSRAFGKALEMNMGAAQLGDWCFQSYDMFQMLEDHHVG